MPTDFSQTLVIGISATALFDLREADRIFQAHQSSAPTTAIRRLNLGISRHAFTGGESVVDYLDAFDVDLFLTTNVEDAQRVIDSGQCPAAIVKPPPQEPRELPQGQVRIAFDGDAVLFDDASELVFKAEGLDAFHRTENDRQDIPLLVRGG